MFKLLLVIGFLFNCVFSYTTPNTFLASEDKERFSELFKLNEPYNKIPVNDLYYSLLGSSILSKDRLFTIINNQQVKKICDLLQSNLDDANVKLDTIYFSSAAAALLNCKIGPNAKVVSSLQGVIKTDVTVADLYKSVLSLIHLGKTIDSAVVSKLLLSALKKDNTLLSSGLALRLAAHFKGADNTKPFLDKVSEILMQADEVNLRFLQFEGGLGVTANIIHGVYSLADSSGKPISLTNDQVIKFTNYFLSRKTVQTVKGAANLLEVLKILSSNNYHIPICLTLYDSPTLNIENPLLTIYVTNVLGQSVASDLIVSAESTAWTGKKTMKPVEGDSTMFTLDVGEIKPKRGSHDVIIHVSSESNQKLIGNSRAAVKMIIPSYIHIDKAEIGVADKDQSGPLKTTPLQFPQHSKNILELDQQQKIIMKFELKDKNSNDHLLAHQVFVQVVNDITKKENIYIAENESGSDLYKFELNMAQRAKDFGFNSGLYHISLIVGDSLIANPFVWKLASIRLIFTSGQGQAHQDKAPWMQATYSPKPVITHIFRQQDKRPPSFVSDAFGLLTLVPVLILFGLWGKLGLNLSGFSLSLSGLIFHLGLGSIFALFTLLWLHLDMFTTIQYLLGLGLITFLSGHSLLSRLANQKSDN